MGNIPLSCLFRRIIQMQIQMGAKLKAFRQQNRMTLVELSTKSGVSKSLLSRIERGHSVPTLTTFQKIAAALSVNVSTLFDNAEDGNPAVTPERSRTYVLPENASSLGGTSKNGNEVRTVSVVRANERKKLIMPWGSHYEMLCPDMRRKIEFIYLRYPVEAKAHEFYSHDGEECGIVLEGRFKALIGNQEFILEPGDSIYYESSIPHRWENVGDVEVKAIWAITPPSF
jgi:transcriptional regulator with XRE-family HTH domain